VLVTHTHTHHTHTHPHTHTHTHTHTSTTTDDKSILIRLKDDYDGAEPSANSYTISNLIRLSVFTSDQKCVCVCVFVCVGVCVCVCVGVGVHACVGKMSEQY